MRTLSILAIVLGTAALAWAAHAQVAAGAITPLHAFYGWSCVAILALFALMVLLVPAVPHAHLPR